MDNIIEVKLTGTRPLLMHNNTMADPLNPKTKAHKELTAKRKKTDSDLEDIAQSEWSSSLYIDETGPYLPDLNLSASLVGGAKLSRLGTKIDRSVEIIDERCYLDYPGPKTVSGLWAEGFYDARGVRVGGRATIIRYRPIFREWSCIVRIGFSPDDLNREDVIKSLQDAGQYVGVGDYRPKFGRFSVEVLQ